MIILPERLFASSRCIIKSHSSRTSIILGTRGWWKAIFRAVKSINCMVQGKMALTPSESSVASARTSPDMVGYAEAWSAIEGAELSRSSSGLDIGQTLSKSFRSVRKAS
jgi:hypothetical protein